MIRSAIGETIESPLTALLLAVSVCLSGCISVSSSKVEQRVVTLPFDDPGATIDAAAQIGQALIKNGMGADVQKRFPNLSPQQLQGVYLTWNVGDFSGKRTVFFLTGIRYSGTLHDAKAVADYCESRVKEAVAKKFPAAASKAKS
jgi:hypothetical protein